MICPQCEATFGSSNKRQRFCSQRCAVRSARKAYNARNNVQELRKSLLERTTERNELLRISKKYKAERDDALAELAKYKKSTK